MSVSRKIARAGGLALVLFALSSCDLIRSIAGRPTSEQLNRKEESARIAENLQAGGVSQAKSLTENEAAEEDPQVESARESLAVKDPEDKAVQPDTLPKTLYSLKVGALGQRVSGLQYRYYVLIGTFTNKAYAREQVRKATQAGYEPQTIAFSQGRRTAVAACGTDSLSVAVAGLEKVRKEAFCPADAYILIAE